METKTTCKLTILIYNKIKHLLGLYPKTEWSGLAFYSKIEPDKLGWTNEWELVDFFPIDLGSTAATEFSGEQEMDMIDKVYKENPKLKDCYRGLIHSHHSLGGGAFFSGTDRNHMKECANKVGYPSLVVAHDSTGSPFAFSWSYVDQLGAIHWTEEEDGIVSIDCTDYKPKGLFNECLASLDKQEKAKIAQTPIGFQSTIFNRDYGFPLGGRNYSIKEESVQTYPYPDKIDNKKLNKKYQKLLTAFSKAEDAWLLVEPEDTDFNRVKQNSVDAEAKLDNFCNLHDISTADSYVNHVRGLI